jgi:hypothetical protein
MPGQPNGNGRLCAWRVLAVVLVVIGVVLGPATLSASAALQYRNDEQGPNDVPGQGDLTRFGVDSAGLPASMLVSWNWDTIALSGGNTADACALFDADNDGRVNVSLCVTVGGNPAAQTATSPRLYGCVDTSVDRCTSPMPVAGFGSTCSVSQTATDPFPAGQSSPMDTTATCTIALADVGASNAKLVNACSYPSQVPNSNPTDCVLIPRDGFIVIDPEPAPGDPPTNVPFTLDGDPAPAFIATGTEPSDPIPVRTDPAAGTHSIAADLPAGSSVTATCSDGSPLSAIQVDSGETVTCTISYKLPDQLSVPTPGFIVINPEPAPDDPPKDVPFTLDEGPVPVFTATGTEPSDPIPVRTDPAAGTHSIDAVLPAGSRVTATCSDGSPISAIDVDSGETVTCTIRYELPDKLSVKASTSAATASAGSTVTIIAVTNRGPGAAGPMNICVRRPARTTLAGATRGARRQNESVCWRRATLAPRKRLRRRVTVRIERTAPGGIVVRVRVRSKGHRVITRRASIRVQAARPDPCVTPSTSAAASC